MSESIESTESIDIIEAKIVCSSLLERTKLFKSSACETSHWKYDSQIALIEKVISLLGDDINLQDGRKV